MPEKDQPSSTIVSSPAVLPNDTGAPPHRYPWEIDDPEQPEKPSRYKPITIRGEPLSETLIRERGED